MLVPFLLLTFIMRILILIGLACFCWACQDPVSPLQETKIGLWKAVDQNERANLLWVHSSRDSVTIETGSWQTYPLLYKNGQWEFSVVQLSTNTNQDTLWLTYPDGYEKTAPVPYVHVSLSEHTAFSWKDLALTEGYWQAEPTTQQFAYYRILEDQDVKDGRPQLVLYSNTEVALRGTVDQAMQGVNYDWMLENPLIPDTIALKGRTLIRPTHYKNFFGWYFEAPKDYSFWVVDQWEQGDTDILVLKAITGPSTGKRIRWTRRQFE